MKRMDLSSTDWFLDAEVVIKASHMQLKVLERNVPGFAREAGRSATSGGRRLGRIPAEHPDVPARLFLAQLAETGRDRYGSAGSVILPGVRGDAPISLVQQRPPLVHLHGLRHLIIRQRRLNLLRKRLLIEQ